VPRGEVSSEFIHRIFREMSLHEREAIADPDLRDVLIDDHSHLLLES
jgi:hypothetical protein